MKKHLKGKNQVEILKMLVVKLFMTITIEPAKCDQEVRLLHLYNHIAIYCNIIPTKLHLILVKNQSIPI